MTSQGSHILAVLLKRLVLAFCILVSDTLVAPNALESLHEGVPRYTIAFEKGTNRPIVVKHGKKYMLSAYIFVLELVSFVLSVVQDLKKSIGHGLVHSSAIGFWKSIDKVVGI